MLVYLARNLINHKVYIGKTTKTLVERKTKHFKDAKGIRTNQAFHSAIRKHGRQNFRWYIIDSSAKSGDKLNDLERKYIAEFKARGIILYNMTNGGDGNTRPKKVKVRVSEEVRRQKISNTLKGRTPWNKGLKTGCFRNRSKDENRNRIANIRTRDEEAGLALCKQR